MDGFKNTTKTQYMTGGSAKRAEAKMGKVMGEFASGKLHSGSKKGPEVKNPKQAVAIAMSEVRKAGAKMPVKKFAGGMMEEGGTYNERGKRATMAEIAAEGRRVENEMAARAAARMAKRKPPVEGISTRPTDSSGRRMTNEELGMTPGGVSPKKSVVKGGALAGAAAGAGALAGAAARAGARVGAKAIPRGVGAMSDREMQMLKETAKKAVPSYSGKPMIRRNMGGLTTMPKGKC